MPRVLRVALRLCVLTTLLTPVAGALDPAPPGGGAAGAGGASLGALLAALLAVLAVKAFLIHQAWHRRNWARIALLILTGLGLGAYAPQLARAITEHPLFGIANLLLVIAEAVAIVLLFTPGANRWYKPAAAAAGGP